MKAMWVVCLLFMLLGAVVGHLDDECGTVDPPPEHVKLQESLLRLPPSYYNARGAATRQQDELCKLCVNIDVVFHILEDTEGLTNATTLWTDDAIEGEIELMNDRFRETPFRFTLHLITRTYDTEIALQENSSSDPEDPFFDVTERLRTGDARRMNVFVSQGTCIGKGGFSLILGFLDYGMFPEGTAIKYDVIVLCAARIGTNSTTLAHEAGHWLGLFHTFQGESCEGPGDMIHDTPAQAFPTRDCFTGNDTCPDHPDIANGINFMDYSDCRMEFSLGQKQIMWYKYNEYRHRVVPCDGGTVVRVEFQPSKDKDHRDLTIAYRIIQQGETPAELIHLLPDLDTASLTNFTNKFLHRDLCLPENSLYQLRFVDFFRAGLEDPGYLAFFLNGREIEHRSEFDGERVFTIFVAGDSATCAPLHKRFSLDITFGSADLEGVSWTLRDSTTQTLLLDSSASTNAGEGENSYNRIFQESTLYFDRCLPPGDYTFLLSVTGDEEPVEQKVVKNYKVSVEGDEIYLGTLGEVRFIVGEIPSFADSVSPSPGADSSGSTGGIGGSFCFPGDATVHVQGRGAVKMSHLAIGDMVRVADAEDDEYYEPVYSFGHFHPDAETEFLTIETEEASTLLHLTPNHMVFVADEHGFVPASSITVGNVLIGKSNQELLVKSVSVISARGMYAPFTPSGQLLVDGVVVSSFVAFESKPTVTILGGIEVSYQWIAHSFEFPHRLECHYFGKCFNESYNEAGISTWVARPLGWGLSVLKLENQMLRRTILSMCVLVLLIYAALEILLFDTNMYVALLGVAFFCILVRRRYVPMIKEKLY